MAVKYGDQYRPDQLEPFWPNEIIKMIVVVLCTLALIMALAVLPVVLDMVGLHGAVHAEEPANPKGATPVGIKPEWYFLAVYQHLKLMPTKVGPVSGKTVGVLSQAPVIMAVMFLPFFYRKRAFNRPGWLYRTVVTAAIFGFLGLTLLGGWPEEHVDGEEQLIPLTHYIAHQPVMFAILAASLIVFFTMISQERRQIRNVLDSSPQTSPKASSGEAQS